MNRRALIPLILASAMGTSGCFTTLAVVGGAAASAGGGASPETLDAILEAAIEADEALFGYLAERERARRTWYEPDVVVSGSVTTDGTPAPATEVRVEDTDGALVGRAFTDASGSFEIRGRPAGISCGATYLSFGPGEGRRTRRIPLPCDATVLDYDLVTGEARAHGPPPSDWVSLEGAVTAGGSPVAGAEVTLQGPMGIVAIASSAADGSYRIDGIQMRPGECEGLHVIIRDAGGRSSDALPVPCGAAELDYDFTTSG